MGNIQVVPLISSVVSIKGQEDRRITQIYTTRYLVDPASSHMLVTKAKPCMCKNKP